MSARQSSKLSKTLSVALCTFNGARFVSAQLESILSQSVSVDEIIICDDFSTDGTWEVLCELAARTPRIKLFRNDRPLGVKKNFERSLSLTTGDLILLSDQDDIWLPNKVEVLLNSWPDSMDKIGLPVLVFSDLSVVDEDLNTLHPSFWRASEFNIPKSSVKKLRVLCVQNFVTGAAAMLNRSLLDIALPFPPTITMHDHWLALVAGQYGQLVPLPRQLVLYRQHHGNVVGLKKTSFWSCLRRFFAGDITLRKKNLELGIKLKQLSSLTDISTSLPPRISSQKIQKFVQAIQRGGASSALCIFFVLRILPMATYQKFLFFVYVLLVPFKIDTDDSHRQQKQA